MTNQRRPLCDARQRRLDPACARTAQKRSRDGDEIVGGPLARDKRFAGTELAAQDESRKEAIVVDMDARVGRARVPEAKDVAIRLMHVAAAGRPCCAERAQCGPSHRARSRRGKAR